MAMRVLGTLVVAAFLLGSLGAGCSDPGPDSGPDAQTPERKVHPQSERSLTCNGMDLRIPTLDASMTLAWASFQVAQQNQEAIAPLTAEARRTLFDTCVLPAIVGEK